MRVICLALLLSLLLAAPRLCAQPASAASLFQQGVTLFQRGEIEAACSKFTQSYRLDAANGTLFNLAACHEKQGRLWTARGEFLKLARAMDAAGKPARARLARQRAAGVETRLPELRLLLPEGSPVATIELDGAPLPRSKWTRPFPVQGGSHVLSFGAPGLRSRTITIATGGEGSVRSVAVPALAPVASGHDDQPTAPAALPGDRGVTGASWWTTKRTAGVIVAGAGAVGVGIGAVFGLQALSQKSGADDACGTTSGPCLDAQRARTAKARISTARSTALVSTIATGAGLAALGAGAYLFFSGGFSSSAPSSSAAGALRVLPTAGPGMAGVALDGRF